MSRGIGGSVWSELYELTLDHVTFVSDSSQEWVIPPPKKPFETIGIDHIGPFKLSLSGFSHIIVCIDYLSRWIEVKPVVDTATKGVLDFLEKQVFLRHGVPSKIISDGGGAFKSYLFAEFLVQWRVKHILASAEHLETNGLVEKANGCSILHQHS